MTIAWYDPTNHHVSTDKNDPLFTPLGQIWPLDVQRTWVGIPEQDLKQGDESFFGAWREGAHWADAYLKQKNGFAEEKNT